MSEHYRARGGIEVVDYVMTNNMNYLESNIVKYIHRYPFKGTAIKDLQKAKECVEMLLEFEMRKIQNDFIFNGQQELPTRVANKSENNS